MKIMILKYLFLLFLLAGLQLHSSGQLMMEDINLEKVPYRSIRKYIELQMEEGRHQFTEIQPSWHNGTDLSAFRKNEMIFNLEGDFTEIWQGYITANPSVSWNGRKISFGLLLRKHPGAIFYAHDPVHGVDPGQVYFLRLKILLGIYNLPVAFEIITVDEENKTIEFSYIEGNTSIGVQQVKFVDLGEGQTEIIHTSYYRSNSRFRDKWMYPHFHKLIINDFHRNMRKLLKRDGRPVQGRDQ